MLTVPTIVPSSSHLIGIHFLDDDEDEVPDEDSHVLETQKERIESLMMENTRLLEIVKPRK